VSKTTEIDRIEKIDKDDLPEFGYPVALNVTRRKCVVVGGGPIGARKAAALAHAGAEVIIVSPMLTTEARVLVEEESVTHIAESFRQEHLDGAFLVVVAPNHVMVNEEIGRAASVRKILVNMAAPGDGSESGDFATMATVRRGELLFAVTCGGASPGLTARLRRELSERYGLEWAMLVDLMGEARQIAKETITDTTVRTNGLRRLVAKTDDLLTLIRAGDFDQAAEEAFECLRP